MPNIPENFQHERAVLKVYNYVVLTKDLSSSVTLNAGILLFWKWILIWANAVSCHSTLVCVCMCVRVCVSVHSVAQLYLTLCDPMDCSLPGSSVHGVSQARIQEWVAISYSRRSSQPKDQTSISCISCIACGFFYHCAIWEAHQWMKALFII